MRTALYVALAALTVSGAALANEQYPTDLPARPIYAGQVLSQTGGEAMPEFGGPAAVVMSGGVEIPNSSEAPVQSANSLPVARAIGGAAHAYAQPVRSPSQKGTRVTARQGGPGEG